MSGDATISSNQPLKPEVTERIAARLREARAESMRSVELATMARADRADGRARMVELRAVEPGFPYYGTLKLGDGMVFDHDAAGWIRRARAARNCSRSWA